jgi:very-short-patch-repair endonuclease
MDGKVVPPNALVAELAGRQHGVVSVAQLRGLGVSEDAVRGRVLAGRLHRVHRGVYAVGHAALSHEGRCAAAVLALGRRSEGDACVLDRWGGAVSHRSAAALWALLPAREAVIDVTVVRGGRAKRHDIRVHRSRSLSPDHVTLCRGIPVTKPARTIADLRWALTARQPGALSTRELRKAARQAAVLGLPVDEDHDVGRTRSDLERDFLRLCRRHDLLRPEVNVRVGPHLVDFLWRGRRLIVETDSYRYHRGKVAFQDDRQRDLDLRGRGYDVIRLSERQINETPDRVARTLAAMLSVGPRR